MLAATSPHAPHALILASASPRRQALLTQLGVSFTVIPANIDERQRAHETPLAYVLRVARAKGRHIARHYPTAVVLSADTIVVLESHILGKPRDAADASQMLSRLSGRTHEVLTGIAVLQQAPHFVALDAVRTTVRFRTLTPADITAYLATGEPFDKAGAYAIQGQGAAFAEAIEGCYTNVVGLPVQRTAALLRLAGVSVPPAPAHSAQTAS